MKTYHNRDKIYDFIVGQDSNGFALRLNTLLVVSSVLLEGCFDPKSFSCRKFRLLSKNRSDQMVIDSL